MIKARNSSPAHFPIRSPRLFIMIQSFYIPSSKQCPTPKKGETRLASEDGENQPDLGELQAIPGGPENYLS
jgi:hypothetical protein